MICTVEGSVKKRALALVKKIVEGYERRTEGSIGTSLMFMIIVRSL